jgi:hypothetical protein
MTGDLDDFSDLIPVGDPEDGGIAYDPVDSRDFYNFADYAEGYFHATRPQGDTDDEDSASALNTDPELLRKMARRYAAETLGYEARTLEWTTVPGTLPLEARHELEGTDHVLIYRPHSATGNYGLFLERYCRLCVRTLQFPIHSLAELGSLLAGKDKS